MYMCECVYNVRYIGFNEVNILFPTGYEQMKMSP